MRRGTIGRGLLLARDIAFSSSLAGTFVRKARNLYTMTLSYPLSTGYVQELRVKMYPDFMCKKDRDTYISTKVCGVVMCDESSGVYGACRLQAGCGLEAHWRNAFSTWLNTWFGTDACPP